MPYADLTKRKLYDVWRNMIARCSDPQHQAYNDYGGRGIAVCEEWHKFFPFYSWALSNGYAESLTLDRIDNDGDYCPDNCRWVSWKVQGNNRRTNTFIAFNGKTQSLTMWADEIGLSKEALWNRIYKFKWPIEVALTAPKGSINKHNRKEHFKNG